MFKPFFIFIFTLLYLVVLPLHSEEIIIWHAFEGFIKDKFDELIQEYNQMPQSHTKVRAIKNGNYTEVYQRGVAAMASKDSPDILQVYEVATLSMMKLKEHIVPIEDLFELLSHEIDRDDFIDVAVKFYSSNQGRMLSLPWNASAGVIFYNKDIFKQLNLDPVKTLESWESIKSHQDHFLKARITGFSTAWPAAYHLENVCALHNQPFFSHENGFKPGIPYPLFNNPVSIYHLSEVQKWQKNGFFSYLGRFTQAEEEFAKGKLAFLLQGANRYSLIKRKANFDIGVLPLPYWKKFTSAPYNLNIGGSSFWVLKKEGQKRKEVAKFLAYLSSPKVQGNWHIITGYLPITRSAYRYCVSHELYSKNPAARVAFEQIFNRERGSYTFGIRVVEYTAVRERIIDFLEEIFSNQNQPAEAILKKANQDIEKMLYEIYVKKD